MSHVVVERFDANRHEVKKFVDTQRTLGKASIDHDPAWLDVLEKAFGHRPWLLVARDPTGEICGYLPLALVSSRLFGRFLVSLPYLNQVGMVARDDAAYSALMDEAVKIADRKKVQYLELRHGAIGIAHRAISNERTEKARMVLELPADEPTLWKAIGGKLRNIIRKGEKSDLSVRFGDGDLVGAFYDVFAVNMRDLGTPVYSRKLFEQIMARFDGAAEIAVADYQGATVAGALIIHDDVARMTAVPSASCLRKFNFTNANPWLYYQLLLRTMARGNKRFDFGRSSKDSGTWRFKAQWGARPVATRWQYYVREGDMDAARPDNPKYQRRIEVWQKLPVWVTRLVGPSIVKGIP